MKKNKLKHICFILDGNKRWAKKNNLNQLDGYKKGIDKIYEIIKYCYDNDIEYVTLYLLSTENVNRKNNNSFFKLANKSFEGFVKKINKIGKIKMNIIGEDKNLPKNILNLIKEFPLKQKNDFNQTINLAFNYGFIDELKSVIKKTNEFALENKMNVDEVNIENFFYLKNQPDPDILIRTGGYNRISNFILKNLIYTELYFLETLWPDLKLSQIKNIILKYNKINRKYGL